MSERLKMVRWGENCDSLLEALTFAETWLAEGIRSFEGIQKFRAYLISEGFTMKGERLYGKESMTWYFPSKPKNKMLCKILQDFAKSYNQTMESLKAQAYEYVIDFIESEERSRACSMENTIYKKELLAVIGEYNQILTRSNNTFNEIETRDYLDYRLNKGENALLITKEHDFQGFDNKENSQEDKYADWVELTGVTHKMIFDNVIKCIVWVFSNMLTYRANNNIYTKYLVGVVPNLAAELVEAFKPYGIVITKMPQHPESEYYVAKNVSEYEISLYFEVIRRNPQALDYPAKELQIVCEAFKN